MKRTTIKGISLIILLTSAAYASEPSRRALPAAFDSVFPSTEYIGPTIGVPNTDPIYPVNKELWKLVPNQVELDQLILRIERQPDTVQTDHLDWGFRVSNLYGMDYRYTTAQGILSNQLLQHNELYGYDPVEVYAQIYFPRVAREWF